MESCDIFIRSYWKDFAWLQLCLASIDRYCRGFRAVIVVTPHSSRPWLRRHPLLTDHVRVEFCGDYRDDYLGQQATKLLADTFTDAYFICHVDSDCIFYQHTTPEDLIVAGKPRVIMRPYALLGRHWPWRRPTEAFLGEEVVYDFMQRPPFTYPRWIYPLLREHSGYAHGVDIETYIMTRPPRGFSEFNTLGAFAWINHPDSFLWVDNSHASSIESPPCRWYWSRDGLDAVTRKNIEAILAPSG